jgi:predicted nucleotidyltransferase
MGRSLDRSAGLADALFSRVQQRVLALLFGQPQRSFYASELIRLAESGTGAVLREVDRLVQSGLVSVKRVGNQKHYQANALSPIFVELNNIVLKTVGMVTPIHGALARHRKKVTAAFIYGSVAKGRDTAKSDIDLMIISDKLAYPDIYASLQRAEATLNRPINPNVLRLDDWKRKLAESNPFIVKINAQPKIFVIGSENELA